MTLPTYTRWRRYFDAQQASPGTVLNGADFDTDYDRIKAFADSVVAAIAQVRRDDGGVSNASIGIDQLKTEVIALLNGVMPKGNWLTATSYSAGDLVAHTGAYYCLVAHTSGTFATDLSTGKWMLLSALTAAASVSSVPAGGLASTDVQSALNELDTEKQPIDATLTAIAGLVGAANTLAYFTGPDTAALTAFTAAARTLLAGVDSPTMLTILGALPEVGGTMTGDLVLAGNPSSDLIAAPKQYVDALAGAPWGFLGGLVLSAAGSTATFGVAAGVAADTTNSAKMALSVPFTKTASAWATGTAVGSLDAGSVTTTTWYHVWLIKNPSSGVVDVLTSLSASNPTMPVGYTLKRRIGSMKTDGSSQWVKFVQNGDNFAWSSPANLITAANPGALAADRTMDVPIGIKVQASFTFRGLSSDGTNNTIYFSDKATTDLAPNTTTSPLADGEIVQAGGGDSTFSGRKTVWTDATGKIRSRCGGTTTNLTVYIQTLGWIDRRGRDD